MADEIADVQVSRDVGARHGQRARRSRAAVECQGADAMEWRRCSGCRAVTELGGAREDTTERVRDAQLGARAASPHGAPCTAVRARIGVTAAIISQ
jgi:hypothetical protein